MEGLFDVHIKPVLYDPGLQSHYLKSISNVLSSYKIVSPLYKVSFCGGLQKRKTSELLDMKKAKILTPL